MKFLRTVVQSILVVAACLVAVSVTPCLSASTLRVDADTGVPTSPCGSESTPCATIQKAVNDASSGDTILVAAGTYTFDPALDPCPAGLTAVVCVSNKFLTIRGGFDNGDWSNSDPQTNLTTIDGENVNRGVLVADFGVPAGLTMEGFTIRRGFGPASNSDINGWGGGVFAREADLTLRNMVIIDNVAKGKDTQTGRGGTGAGGGVAVRGIVGVRVTGVFENVTCEGNTAQGGTGPERGGGGQGGGMWLYYADSTGDNLVFTGNTARAGHSNGGGVLNGFPGAHGGAIAFKEESISVFSNVTAMGNFVIGGNANATSGQAGFGFAGGLFGEEADFTVTDLVATGNTVTGGNAATAGGAFGGGFYSLNSEVRLDRALIQSNTVQGGYGVVKKGTAGGGGVFFEDVDGSASGRQIAVENAIISDNSVILGSGGDVNVSGGGGGVFLNGAQAVLTHCTVAHNSLSSTPMSGRAIVVVTRTPASPVPAHLDFNYGIISDHVIPGGNTSAAHVIEGSSLTFYVGLFANNEAETSGTGTISGLATMDTESTAGYVSPGSPEFDYHLRDDSPAIDAALGSSTVRDIDGDLRDESPDNGADELVDDLFADGFESGDTTAWSVKVP